MKAYIAILISAFTLGVALIAASFCYDWYTVPRAELDNLSIEISKLPREERFAQWVVEIRKLETPRKKLVDVGSGLATLSAVLGLLFWVVKFPFANAKTPPQRWMFLVLFWVAMVVFIPLSFLCHQLRIERYEYPSWSDPFLIDFTNFFVPYLFSGIAYTLIFLPFLAFAKFPAPLWIWSSRHTCLSWLIAILLAVPAALLLLYLPFLVNLGAFSNVFYNVILAYLLLSLRAGIIQRTTKNNP